MSQMIHFYDLPRRARGDSDARLVGRLNDAGIAAVAAMPQNVWQNIEMRDRTWKAKAGTVAGIFGDLITYGRSRYWYARGVQGIDATIDIRDMAIVVSDYMPDAALAEKFSSQARRSVEWHIDSAKMTYIVAGPDQVYNTQYAACGYIPPAAFDPLQEIERGDAYDLLREELITRFLENSGALAQIPSHGVLELPETALHRSAPRFEENRGFWPFLRLSID